MAKTDAESAEALRREMLARLGEAIPALFRRYEALWHRERHPRGLEPIENASPLSPHLCVKRKGP